MWVEHYDFDDNYTTLLIDVNIFISFKEDSHCRK